VVWFPAAARGLSTFQSVETGFWTHLTSNSDGGTGYSPRVKRRGREANQLLMLALWMSGSLPLRFHGVHRDIFILILIFNVTAIMCKFTNEFIRLVFVIETQRLLLDLRTEILNVLGELPESTALSWCSNRATDYNTEESCFDFQQGLEIFSSPSCQDRLWLSSRRLVTATENSLAAGAWSWPHPCSAECV
jgi:hypothetical protein